MCVGEKEKRFDNKRDLWYAAGMVLPSCVSLSAEGGGHRIVGGKKWFFFFSDIFLGGEERSRSVLSLSTEAEKSSKWGVFW